MYYSIYYKFDNYKKECLDEGEPVSGWNSNQSALLKIDEGDVAFVFTTLHGGGRSDIYLLAILIANESFEDTLGHYGKYYLDVKPKKSAFFEFDESTPITPLFRKLDFKKGWDPSKCGQTLQSIQVVSDKDAQKLIKHSKKLKLFSGNGGSTLVFADSYGEAAKEGGIVVREHAIRERDPRISKTKKARFKKKHGHLFCEACEFDFEETYGSFGEDYIECHHIRPLSSLKKEKKTTMDDLVLLCSNCHRMVHRKKEPLPISKLKKMLR